ncbi:SDR family NAD(P)-dependent oxidoreductase [Nonomuraea candida]|uniref:SDR family NAD(P)-dependent oxidoreductase n=1 Tax=Nonomuraea candida TaxID=359159 RepID=UPI000694B501|nr:SDR family NAD(P)-dependent oxidoreductase [Nonomuraea candida]
MTGTGTVLITGGTGGLGYETAGRLAAARPGWTVLITGRDARRADDAARRLSAGSGGHVVGARLDLASLAEVRAFAAELPGRGLPPLRGIVCNAGTQVVRGITYTEDGFETTFAVNHLAHFLLVNLLLPAVAGEARIVFVASDTHDPARRTGMPAPRWAAPAELARSPRGESPREGRRRYTTSKLCNVLTAYELARRRPDLRVNAFDPGLMPGTGLARDYSRLHLLAWRHVLPALALLPGLGVRTAGRSGAALAALVAAPRFAAVTGAYFSGLRAVRSSEASYSPELAADLWRGSAELAGLETPGLETPDVTRGRAR